MSDSTPTILFVDDEPDVLDGIRSSLRRERKRFDLRFASSGDEALAMLADDDVAVLVSDMRMPKMNGAELLERARAGNPAVVRIVLTGEAEAELVMRAIHVAHQWLSKPCQRDDLVAAIDSALRYRALLVDPARRAAIGRIATLPSPPSRYLRLVDLIRSPNVASTEIAAEIGTDPAVAAKVVHLANSAFSGGEPVVDLTNAVTRIGLENVAHLVLSAELHRPSDDDFSLPGTDIETLADMSVLAAVVAQGVVGPDLAPSVRLAALLHNVGLIVEAQAARDQLAADHELALSTGTSLIATQMAEHGASHVDVGAHLLSMWGLPVETVLAVASTADDHPHDGPGADVAAAVRHGAHMARHRFASRLSPPLATVCERADCADAASTLDGEGSLR